MLTSADKLHWNANFTFSSGLDICLQCKCTKSWTFCVWWASRLTWPEPYKKSMIYWQEEDETPEPTTKMTWSQYQSNLGFHYTSTEHPSWTPPRHWAAMHWFMQREDQPSSECIKMCIIFKKSDICLKNRIFLYDLMLFLF